MCAHSFIEIDSRAKRRTDVPKDATASTGAVNVLSRVEFFVALVQVAINKFIRTKQLSDVSGRATNHAVPTDPSA